MDTHLLQAGIKWWLRQRGWDEDFFNSFYCRLYDLRPDQLNDAWWASIVDVLSGWRAIRPDSKDQVRERGLERLGKINRLYRQIRRKTEHEPTLEDVSWNDIASLFKVMREIKNADSPVFPSKMGHFLLPRVFLPIDNTATGVFAYQYIWRMSKLAWSDFTERDEAIQMLAAEIKRHTTSPLHPDYPFETKIPELCLIGCSHG